MDQILTRDDCLAHAELFCRQLDVRLHFRSDSAQLTTNKTLVELVEEWSDFQHVGSALSSSQSYDADGAENTIEPRMEGGAGKKG